MRISDGKIEFAESDLKEVFGLFTSCSKQELDWNYDPARQDFFEQIVLLEEYELTQERREFALDALRATLFFLYHAGYQLEKDGRVVSLVGITDYFV
ncbi:MAG: hypothetical protein HYR56_00155 [Acidobacteria bacterium]|nr:hypothetical protein [Acidobacteriota bacterium]MBI3423225.1 hypothetical protein [Acidobacteriota bacterium]